MSILKKTQIDYKWVILIVCFVMEFFVLGFCSSNAGLYTKSVTEALDIPRSLYSIGNSIRYVAQILVAMTFGHVISRFGVKKVAGFGFATLAFSVVVRAIAANIIHIYIGNVLWGIGIVFSGNTIAGTIIRRWFKKGCWQIYGYCNVGKRYRRCYCRPNYYTVYK